MTPRTYRPSRLDRALWSFQMVILVVFVVRSIRDAIATTEGIAGIRELRTIHIGPDDLVVAAGVWVDATRTATAISHSIDTAERRVGEIAPFRTIISIEPRVRDPAPTAHDE